jgi:thioesterase domain-containing protein/acyl carrier protein
MFPLTPNGKVDRQRLLAENHSSSNDEETFIAARNPIEIQLTKIWETVLGRHPIGVTDNFFHLGGESLMAVRLCSEIERTLQRKIPVTLIFHAQTIEQLALNIEQKEKTSSTSLMLTIQAGGKNPPIFCVLFGSNFRPYLKHYPNQPLYNFLNQGYDGRRALHTTVEDIATRYLKEMRTVQPVGPYYLAGFSFGGMVVFDMAQQLRKQGETIGLLALVDPTSLSSKSEHIPWGTQLNHLVTTKTVGREKGVTHFHSLFTSIVSKALGGVHWRWHRLKGTPKILRKTYGSKIRKLLCEVYFIVNYPLPPSLARFYRRSIVRQAIERYLPQPYPGKIILFQTKPLVKSYWGKLCGEIEQVYDLSCKHGDIYRDGPLAPRLLYQLMDCLEKCKKEQE